MTDGVVVRARRILIVTTVAGLLMAYLGAAPPLGGLLPTSIAVLVITCVVTAILYARGNGATAMPTVSKPAAAPVARMPKLIERLPQRLRAAELHALEAEDHYLRVHTSAGSDLILMRLGDAIAELEGVEGARTHRSWWVARDAVRSFRRADGRAELTLPGGVVAPVIRSFVAPLRERGWFG